MDNVPQKIITYLLEKFVDVEAIILHGSRVTGFARKHSDWDFIVLTNTKQKQDMFRHDIDEYHFEFKIEALPITIDDIFERFDTKLQFSKVIYDVSGEGARVLGYAKKFYSLGVPKRFLDHDANLKKHRKQNRIHIIKNLEDNIDNPAMFMKKMNGLYPQIINEWYWYRQKDFPKNLYISIPEIEQKDPWFLDKLKVLYEDGYTKLDKISALSDMIEYIYE